MAKGYISKTPLSLSKNIQYADIEQDNAIKLTFEMVRLVHFLQKDWIELLDTICSSRATSNGAIAH